MLIKERIMKLNEIPEINNLSKAEKIVLLEDLWDSISAEDSDIPIPDGHIKVLQDRYDDYKKNPENVITFQNLQKKINDRK